MTYHPASASELFYGLCAALLSSFFPFLSEGAEGRGNGSQLPSDQGNEKEVSADTRKFALSTVSVIAWKMGCLLAIYKEWKEELCRSWAAYKVYYIETEPIIHFWYLGSQLCRSGRTALGPNQPNRVDRKDRPILEPSICLFCLSKYYTLFKNNNKIMPVYCRSKHST